MEFRRFSQLILNYAGQAAIVLEGTSTQTKHFLPALSVVTAHASGGLGQFLATMNIASQSIITGAFLYDATSNCAWMDARALRVTQTSEEGYGQIYVGSVNWLLMIATLCLTVIFP